MPDSLCKLFRYGAENKPNEVAITDGTGKLTYGELEVASSNLCALFTSHGVNARDHIVVLTEKSIVVPLIVGAIWKAGACYVPVDAENPAARTQKLVASIQPTVLLGDEKSREKFAGYTYISFQEVQQLAERDSKISISPQEVSLDDIGYIIHTSGSTGEPKGVKISHRSLLAYFASHNSILQFNHGSRVLRFSPFHFDLSIEDTILPLGLGAYVFLYKGMLLGPIVKSVMKNESITHLVAVSTILGILGENSTPVTDEFFPDLKTIVTGTERCVASVVNEWLDKADDLRVLNGYGPTEVTINCVSHTITKSNALASGAYPIGIAMDGVDIKLIDDVGEEIIDPGIQGELWAGGIQVMVGYHDKLQETREVIKKWSGIRYYKTGDICEYTSDGDLFYVGRVDNEVKLEGKRIHLGEIQSQILKLDRASQVVVGTVKVGDRQKICAILVGLTDSSAFDDVIIKTSNVLPQWMMPKVWAIASKPAQSTTGKTHEKELVGTLQVAVDTVSSNKYVQTQDGGFLPYRE